MFRKDLELPIESEHRLAADIEHAADRTGSLPDGELQFFIRLHQQVAAAAGIEPREGQYQRSGTDDYQQTAAGQPEDLEKEQTEKRKGKADGKADNAVFPL
jgi:hypothetical protein